MTKVSYFKETNIEEHWSLKPLEGYIYEDVFDLKFAKLAQKNVQSILNKSSKLTYFTHNTTFYINNEERKIVSHAQNAREQNVIFDLSFDPEWYHQTIDTIKDWSRNKITETVSPIFQRCVQKIESLEPIASEVNDWVPYRLHVNYLKYTTCLDLHVDTVPGFSKNVDRRHDRTYSFTFYFFDHIEGLGGEFWSYNGFVFKPKFNSAILINGNQCMHGVTANMHQAPRLAFTCRLAHKEDLFLPGHPSKYLYNVLKL